ELRNIARAPIDLVIVAVRQNKPGDLRRPVADRDQRHHIVLAATQANSRDLLKRHVDYAAHSQPLLVRLTVLRHGEASADVRRTSFGVENANARAAEFTRRQAFPATGRAYAR